MMRLLFLPLLALTLTGPATAQSFDDAVRGNLALALKLCLSGTADHEAWAQSFYSAGFTGRVDRSTTNSDTTHYLEAPSGTVQVELYYGETPEFCSVSSTHMGVTAAGAILDLVVPMVRTGYLRKNVPGQGAACVTYEDPTNPIGEIIGVNSADGESGCAEDGTVTFYASYRV